MKRFSCSLVFRSVLAAIATSLPIAAHAQDRLIETLTPEPRPYPGEGVEFDPAFVLEV